MFILAQNFWNPWFLCIMQFSWTYWWFIICKISNFLCTKINFMFLKCFHLYYKHIYFLHFGICLFTFLVKSSVEPAIITTQIDKCCTFIKNHIYSCLSISTIWHLWLTLSSSYYRFRNWGWEVKLLIHTTECLQKWDFLCYVQYA